MAVIDRNIQSYIVFSGDSITHALKKISENQAGFVVAVSEHGVVDGILTDGDFRRWVVSQNEIHLDSSVSNIVNRDYRWASSKTSATEIAQGLDDNIRFLLLLDDAHRLVGVAKPSQGQIQIGKFKLGPDTESYLIAEIGNNHNGDFDLAKKLVNAAKAAGANCAKFQMRQLESLYTNAGNSNDEKEDLGSQYTLDLLSRFQLSNEEMFKIFDYCKSVGIQPLCTPWESKSLELLEEYGMEAYKVASADFTNHGFLLELIQTGKPLICSTGMSTDGEIRDSVQLLKKHNAQFILLHCNSTYPAPFKDINLHYMTKLKTISGGLVGYSGHERGIHIPLAAISLGAKVVEKHFTLDRNMEGNDHRVSLLPQEFEQMVKQIRELEEAMGTSASRQVSQGELMNREILGKSVVAKADIKSGTILKAEHLEIKSPGRGLAPYKLPELIGRKASRDIERGDFFYPSDLGLGLTELKPFQFSRPFGVPVRYHDVNKMISKSNISLVEFHFSYKDLDLKAEKYFSEQRNIEFVVHSPELFANDHIMDLAAFDEDYRRHSVKELQRVIDVTRQLNPYFKTERPLIIINAGGFTLEAHMPVADRSKYYDQIAKSLSELDSEGVEIIPQTMPPFPWHFGGQRFQNLFMDPLETRDFCEQYNMRICLDISHSKLACNHFKWSFSEFIQMVGPYTAHIHVVDAKGVDGEGLQILEGDIDFKQLAKELAQSAPKASFIPEIWQGHKNDGEGFWVALDRLQSLNF